MFVVNVTYAVNKNVITLSRTVENENDLKTVIGEALYGVETQCQTFKTHDMFERLNIPEVLKLNCTVLKEQIKDAELKVTIARKRAK